MIPPHKEPGEEAGERDGDVVGWREGWKHIHTHTHRHTHAWLWRAEDKGGRGRGSHTTYCERLKGATVPKC